MDKRQTTESNIGTELLNMLSTIKYLANKIGIDNVFEKLDHLRKTNNTWSKDVFIPLNVVVEYICADLKIPFNSENAVKIIEVAKLITALYTWRYYKKVYSFDKDLVNTIINQDITDMKIDAKFLSSLPSNGMCMYIPEIDKDASEEWLGQCMIVLIDFDMALQCNSLMFYNIIMSKDEIDGNVIGVSILPLLEGKTFSECIDAFYTEKNTRSEGDIDFEKQNTMKIVNCLLYILSANADTKPSPVTASTYRKSDPNFIKDKFREIEITDVGCRIGSVIRKHREEKVNGKCKSRKGIGEGSSKSPHVRCGHWHYYWTGSRSDKASRTKILKWLPPVFVNGYVNEATTINVSPVRI